MVGVTEVKAVNCVEEEFVPEGTGAVTEERMDSRLTLAFSVGWVVVVAEDPPKPRRSGASETGFGTDVVELDLCGLLV